MEGVTGRKSMRGRPRGEPTAVIRLPLPLAGLARRLREGTLRAGDISRFLAVESGERRTIRFIKGTAACGFPSPADDYLEHPLDFSPDSPDGLGRQDRRPRKCWRNRRLLLSPVGSVRIRLLDPA